MIEQADLTEFVDDILARQAAARVRLNAIANAGEAVGRENLAFALACRRDLSADRAIDLLSAAPAGLREPRDIWNWLDAIPPQPETETMQ